MDSMCHLIDGKAYLPSFHYFDLLSCCNRTSMGDQVSGQIRTLPAFSYTCKALKNSSCANVQQKVNVTQGVLKNLEVFSEIHDFGRHTGNKHSFYMTEIKYLSSDQFRIVLEQCKKTWYRNSKGLMFLGPSPQLQQFVTDWNENWPVTICSSCRSMQTRISLNRFWSGHVLVEVSSLLSSTFKFFSLPCPLSLTCVLQQLKQKDRETILLQWSITSEIYLMPWPKRSKKYPSSQQNLLGPGWGSEHTEHILSSESINTMVSLKVSISKYWNLKLKSCSCITYLEILSLLFRQCQHYKDLSKQLCLTMWLLC